MDLLSHLVAARAGSGADRGLELIGPGLRARDGAPPRPSPGFPSASPRHPACSIATAPVRRRDGQAVGHQHERRDARRAVATTVDLLGEALGVPAGSASARGRRRRGPGGPSPARLPTGFAEPLAVAVDRVRVVVRQPAEVEAPVRAARDPPRRVVNAALRPGQIDDRCSRHCSKRSPAASCRQQLEARGPASAARTRSGARPRGRERPQRASSRSRA